MVILGPRYFFSLLKYITVAPALAKEFSWSKKKNKKQNKKAKFASVLSPSSSS